MNNSPKKFKVKKFKKSGIVYTKAPPGSTSSSPFFLMSMFVSLRNVLSQFQPINLHLFHTFRRNIGLLLIPVVLFVVFIVLTVVNTFIGIQIVTNQVTSAPSVNLHPYPVMQSSQVPVISAKAAIVMDAESKVVLYAKQPDLRFSLASTTKIMTALVGLDYYHDDSLLQVKPIHVEGSQIGLEPGDTLTFHDLLYAMLLPSANDAAITVADNYPGGVSVFVEQMNRKASSLHLLNTHFADPVGLNDDGDYSTVFDMAHLAAFAETNGEFAEIANTKEKTIYSHTFGRTYVLNNLNKLLGIDGVNGIKTGTTEGAGEVLVTSTMQNGHQFIIIVMNSDDRFADTMTLIGFLQYVSFFFPEPLPMIR